MSSQLLTRDNTNLLQNNEIFLNFRDKKLDSHHLKLLLNKSLTNNFIKSLFLQLNDNIIGDQGFKELVSYLNTLQKLENLSLFLSSNQFTCIGIQNLQNLRFNENLKNLTLQLSNNLLGEQAIEIIGLFLSKQSSLSKLHLILDNCDLGNCGAISLCKQLKELKKLNELQINLNDNSITDNGAIGCISEICKIKTLTQLELNICSHKIDSQDFRQQQYQLYQNVISNDCVKKIIKIIGSQLPNLTKLNMEILYYTNQSCQQFKKQGYEGLEKDLVFSKQEVLNLLDSTFHKIQTKHFKI